MNYDAVFLTHSFCWQSAEAYGFQKKEGRYELRAPLAHPEFYVVITIYAQHFEIVVKECLDDAEYALFHVESAKGSFVEGIRKDVDDIMEAVISNCFLEPIARKELLNYVCQCHGTALQQPWERYKEYFTVKTKNKKKWYAVFMRVPFKSLGIEKEGMTDIVNVKGLPEQIAERIDLAHYFPAYHMNKKHWLSVLLDAAVDIEEVKKLLDDSYTLVETGSRKKR